MTNLRYWSGRFRFWFGCRYPCCCCWFFCGGCSCGCGCRSLSGGLSGGSSWTCGGSWYSGSRNSLRGSLWSNCRGLGLQKILVLLENFWEKSWNDLMRWNHCLEKIVKELKLDSTNNTNKMCCTRFSKHWMNVTNGLIYYSNFYNIFIYFWISC